MTTVSNHDRILASRHNSRSRKMNVPGEFTAEEWVELRQKYGNVCIRCGRNWPESPDHVIALCEGGTNFIENIQPLCLGCNLSKTMNIDYRHETLEKREKRWKYLEQVRTQTQGRGSRITITVPLTGHHHDEISLYLIDQGIEPTPQNIQHLVYGWIKHDLKERVQKLL